MLSRRKMLIGLGSGAGIALAIPAIVKATSLMPVSNRFIRGRIFWIAEWKAMDQYGRLMGAGRFHIFHPNCAADALNWVSDLIPDATAIRAEILSSNDWLELPQCPSP